MLVVVSILWFVSESNNRPEQLVNSREPTSAQNAVADTVSNEPLKSSDPSVDQSNQQDADKTQSSLKTKKPTATSAQQKKEEANVQPTTPAAKTETGYVPAEPIKGYPELYSYFSNNLLYPKEAMKDSVQGVLTVSFIINKNGKPEKIEVANSLGTLLDQEAIRLIREMPEWKPAVLNGKPIPSRISLPITFQLVKVKAQ
jgi:TonB family protein